MAVDESPQVALRIDADRWISRPGCRTVLCTAHTVVSAQRVLDVVECIEDDPRIQVVFTVAPDVFNHGVADYLRKLGALLLPWEQAVNHRFDLALAAAYGGLHQIHAPLVVLAHGAGHGKPVHPPANGGALARELPVYGLDAQRLSRDGRGIAAAVALCHEDELGVLRRQCPEAVPAALIIGDPCYDRLIASLPLRDRYRRALHVEEHQRLVVVSSTWGRAGLFGRVPDLLSSMMDQLPGGHFRVAALLHPAVWGAHGVRQVRAWLRECRQAGLILPEPTDDWRALVVAADHVVGDHGSVTAYAAALGRPVLLGPGPTPVPTPGSPQHVVISTAGRLVVDLPLATQLAQAPVVDQAAVTAALTSRPGGSASVLRRRMYELMGLPEPGRQRGFAAVPVPVRVREPQRRAAA